MDWTIWSSQKVSIVPTRNKFSLRSHKKRSVMSRRWSETLASAVRGCNGNGPLNVAASLGPTCSQTADGVGVQVAWVAHIYKNHAKLWGPSSFSLFKCGTKFPSIKLVQCLAYYIASPLIILQSSTYLHHQEHALFHPLSRYILSRPSRQLSIKKKSKHVTAKPFSLAPPKLLINYYQGHVNFWHLWHNYSICAQDTNFQ